MKMFFFPRMMKPKFSFPVSVTDKIKSCMEFLSRHSLIFTLFKLFVWMYKLELWANVASHEVQLNCSPPLHSVIQFMYGEISLCFESFVAYCARKRSQVTMIHHVCLQATFVWDIFSTFFTFVSWLFFDNIFLYNKGWNINFWTFF